MSRRVNIVWRATIVSIMVASFCLAATVAYAQSGGGNQVVLVITPQNPRPNTEATIEVKAIFTELERANIGWLENGKLSESGLGKTIHRFVVGDVGSSIEITVVASSVEGIVYEKSITVRPELVDVVWETTTTVPPFYRGKALHTMFGGLRIVAVPTIVDEFGEKIDPKELYYTWKKDTTVFGSKSGYGKQSFVFSDPEFRYPLEISVSVSDKSGLFSADQTVFIDAAEPMALLYENSPLYGILFNRAIRSEFVLTGREATFELFPYFFNTRSRNNLTYSWTVNGAEATEFKGPYLTVRNVGGGSGTASASFDVQNLEKLLEGASGGLTIKFGNQ